MKPGKELMEEVRQPCRKETLRFWWLGQMGYLIRTSTLTILIDAYLSADSDRVIPPLLQPSEAVGVDYVFGSHDHLDHIDRRVWPALAEASPKARFVVPNLVKNKLVRDLKIPEDRLIGISDGKTVEAEDISITGVASAHEFLDQDPKTGEYPYMGFSIKADGFHLFHTGDTCNYEGYPTKLKQLDPIHILFLPINGRDAVRYCMGCIGNMTFQEAVDLAGTVHPSLCVPGHFDMFRHNSADPVLFEDYLAAKYPSVTCQIPRHSEQVLFWQPGRPLRQPY